MKRRYSPVVLRLAQEHGIDLENRGDGQGGRITRKDVLRYIEGGKGRPSVLPNGGEKQFAAPVKKPAAPESIPAAEPCKGGARRFLEEGDRVVPVTSVRRTIAQRMVTSKHEAPHAWTMVEADVTGLVQLRERLKKEFKEREGISLTYLPFFIKAVVDSLKEFPYLNSVWAGDRIILKKRINISIAVATDDALYVPVIHDADEKSIAGLAKAVHRLAEKTRAGKLTLEDMQGEPLPSITPVPSDRSCPSRSSLICRRRSSVVDRETSGDQGFDDRHPGYGQSLPVFDHRILDGLMAGRFLQRVKERVEAYGPGYADIGRDLSREWLKGPSSGSCPGAFVSRSFLLGGMRDV